MNKILLKIKSHFLTIKHKIPYEVAQKYLYIQEKDRYIFLHRIDDNSPFLIEKKKLKNFVS